MKKILITGAGGCVGTNVIRYLLSEGKYEITALDLKNKKVFKNLNRYRKRVNIVYGDILDRTLIENLVKDHEIIIHLATCLPPLSDYKYGLANVIEYEGIENIIRAISYYNPKCHLIYASTTSLFKKACFANDKPEIGNYDFFNEAKYNSEKLINKKMKNFTILRLPLILTDLRKDPFIYNVKKDELVEVITKEDAAYALVSAASKLDVLNKKTLNIGGGKTCQDTYENIVLNILKYHGLSFNYIFNRLFIAKNYTSPVLLDSDESNKILNYRNDSLDSYYMRQKRRSKNRKFSKMLSKLLLKIIKRRKKD